MAQIVPSPFYRHTEEFTLVTVFSIVRRWLITIIDYTYSAATSDRDELTDSGGSKQEKSKQTRRGKQVPSGSEASSANGSAGKAKVVKEPVKRVPAKKRKMNVIESDPEDDDESVIIDSSNEGGEQVDDTPSNKKPKTTTGAIRGQRKNVKSAKGKFYILCSQ